MSEWGTGTLTWIRAFGQRVLPMSSHVLPHDRLQGTLFPYKCISITVSNFTSCIRRGCYSAFTTRRICTQLKRSTLEGCCSCVFDEGRVLSLSDKVEQCLSAHPVTGLFMTHCGCDSCMALTPLARWLAKNKQAPLHCQSDICCCKGARVEMIY